MPLSASNDTDTIYSSTFGGSLTLAGGLAGWSVDSAHPGQEKRVCETVERVVPGADLVAAVSLLQQKHHAADGVGVDVPLFCDDEATMIAALD